MLGIICVDLSQVILIFWNALVMEIHLVLMHVSLLFAPMKT